MGDVVWGPEILVDGKRPEWLARDQQVDWSSPSKPFYGRITERAHEWAATDWACVSTIRLPADHPAYIAIDKGFAPWSGGDAAPEDWDGGEVLRRGGTTRRPIPWSAPYSDNQRWTHVYTTHPGNFADIIGYRKRATAAEPATADTVQIARMTEAEAVAWWQKERPGWISRVEVAVMVLKTLNLIRQETTAERFTRETGHAVTAAVLAALQYDR